MQLDYASSSSYSSHISTLNKQTNLEKQSLAAVHNLSAFVSVQLAKMAPFIYYPEDKDQGLKGSRDEVCRWKIIEFESEFEFASKVDFFLQETELAV